MCICVSRPLYFSDLTFNVRASSLARRQLFPRETKIKASTSHVGCVFIFFLVTVLGLSPTQLKKLSIIDSSSAYSVPRELEYYYYILFNYFIQVIIGLIETSEEP